MAGGYQKHILVVSQLPPPYHGSTIMTALLVKTLGKLTYDLSLVDRRFSRTVAEVGRPDGRKVVKAVGLLLRLARVLVFRRPDACVFFVTNRTGSFVVDCATSLMLRSFRVPYIAYVHTSGYRSLANRGWVWHNLVRFLIGGAATTVVLGESLRADIEEYAGNITTIPNAISSHEQIFGLPRSYVLFYSNLIEEKGADVFVEMAISMSAHCPGTNFVVAGAHPDPALVRKLRTRIAEAGLGSQIVIIGPVSSEGRWELLSQAQLLVFPSSYRFEAQPLSIIEAFACGTAVVAFAVGGIADLFTATPELLVPAGDTAMLETVVSELIKDSDLRNSLGATVREVFESHYAQNIYQENWARLLSDY